MSDLDEILHNPVSRRAFLTRMSAAGIGAAAVALLAGCGGSSHDNNNGSTGTTAGLGGSTGGSLGFVDPKNFPGIPGKNIDEVVLNFALTLETLEADLYRQALNIASGLPVGAPLQDPSAYPATATVPDGGLGALAPVGYLYLKQYAQAEAAHEQFLRLTLQGAAIQRYAKGYTTGLAPGTDLKTILNLISVVEEEGVRAYLGAAGFLTNPGFLAAATSIYTTEARHSTGINVIIGRDSGPRKDYAAPSSPDQMVQPKYPQPNTFEYYKNPSDVLKDVTTAFYVK